MTRKRKQEDSKVISLHDRQTKQAAPNSQWLSSAFLQAKELLEKREIHELTQQVDKIEATLEKSDDPRLILPLCHILEEMNAFSKASHWLKEALNRTLQQEKETSSNETHQEDRLDHILNMMNQGLFLRDWQLVLEIYSKLPCTHFHPQSIQLAAVAAFNLRKYKKASQLWNNAFETSQEPYYLKAQEIANMVLAETLPPFTIEYKIDHHTLAVMQGISSTENLDLEALEKTMKEGGGKLFFLMNLFGDHQEEDEIELLLTLLVENTGEWGVQLLDKVQKMNRFSKVASTAAKLKGFTGNSLDDVVSMILEEKGSSFWAIEEDKRQAVEEKGLPKQLAFIRGIKNMPVHWLRTMCRLHDLDPKGKRPQLEQQLEATLLTPDHLLETLALLEEAEWQVMESLLDQQGFSLASHMVKTFGTMKDDGYQWYESDGPRSTLGKLWLKGLIMVGCHSHHQQREKVVVIPHDIYQLLPQLWPKAAAQRLQPKGYPDEKLALDYIRAAVNLYGIVTPEKLTEIYNRHHQTPIEATYWKRYEKRTHEVFLWHEAHYVMIDVLHEDLYHFLMDEQQGKAHYMPDKKEFLKYAEDGYSAQNKPYHQLKRFLNERFIIPKQNLTDLCDEMLLAARHVHTLQELMEELHSLGILFKEQEELHEVTKIMIAMMNHSRRWENCGHTPDEVFRKHQPATENVLKAEKKTKVGRNEPCPCGSGKKYKHCCLK